MICQTCNGKREVPNYDMPWKMAMHSKPVMKPCQDCLGGEQHCCEGEQCQPDLERTR